MLELHTQLPLVLVGLLLQPLAGLETKETMATILFFQPLPQPEVAEADITTPPQQRLEAQVALVVVAVVRRLVEVVEVEPQTKDLQVGMAIRAQMAQAVAAVQER